MTALERAEEQRQVSDLLEKGYLSLVPHPMPVQCC
jgi:hypothetical protein